MKTKVITIIFIITSTILLSNCAVFKAQNKVNLAPFAENAVSIVSEIEYGLSKGRAIHTRSFIGGPASQAYKAQWMHLGQYLRGIVAYSVQLVTISQSKAPDNKKAVALADYIAVLAGPASNDTNIGFRINEDDFQDILTNIRKQDTYFDALNAAQPIVDEVARVTELVIIDLKEAQEQARIEVAERIEADHSMVLQYKDEFKEGQSRTLQTAVYLGMWRKGDKSVEDSILITDPAMKEFIKPGQKFTYEIVNQMAEVLVGRLEAAKLIQSQLYPEMEQYQKEMHELDELIAISDRGIKQSKAAIVVWRRAHQTMAAGITEPAAIDLFGMAKAAIKSFAPIP